MNHDRSSGALSVVPDFSLIGLQLIARNASQDFSRHTTPVDVSSVMYVQSCFVFGSLVLWVPGQGEAYQSKPAQSACHQCPDQTQLIRTSSMTSREECICKTGYWRPDGRYMLWIIHWSVL